MGVGIRVAFGSGIGVSAGVTVGATVDSCEGVNVTVGISVDVAEGVSEPQAASSARRTSPRTQIRRESNHVFMWNILVTPDCSLSTECPAIVEARAHFRKPAVGTLTPCRSQ